MKRIESGRLVLLRVYSAYTSGPRGVEGRLPYSFERDAAKSTSVAIADPFILYQSCISLGILEKDAAQLRMMKEFQKLHHRVIDYNPPQDLAIQAALLLRKLEIREAEEQQKVTSLRNQPIYKLRLWFRRDIDTQRREVVRFMSDEEELHNIASRQGLLVNGEVGCGKSMLMDIFANCLPHTLR